ncbi:ABC transporter substrate-binding protein [Fibrella rubiginis]|nr:ABC transporter substrate-binding protein [Fibrella rubiginis]
MSPTIGRVSLILGFIGLVIGGYAQKVTDTERRYRAGVKALQSGEYDRARNELQVVMQRGGSFAPYAYYYHADASFRQKKYPATRSTIKELIDHFPDWRKRGEAYYLAACAAMEQGLVDEALSYTDLITEAELRPDVERMERNFLSRITDLNRLKALQAQYPKDKTLAMALIDLIQESSTDKADLELSDRLTNRFGVTPTPRAPRPAPAAPPVEVAKPRPAVAAKTREKGTVNVGVMLPFRLDRFDPEDRSRTNQYAYDLLEGMKMARNKLFTEGITINLFAYDIDNDADQTLELLNNAAFGQNDLLVGPLFSEPNRLVADYALQNNVTLVNPISTSRDLIANHPTAYLAQPSTWQQAAEAVQFMKGQAIGRKAAVYFGNARKDSLLATAYAAELKAQGFQVVDYKRVSGKNMTLGIVETNKPNHVFFASSNEDDGVRMLDAMNRSGVVGPLVTTYPAFNYFRNSLATFTRRTLLMLAPEFMDLGRNATKLFEEAYIAKRAILPSVFVAQGYDLMLFFGRQLAKGSIKSRTNLVTSPEDDYVLSGFDYTQSNDNRIVPIIKFDGARFQKINE